MFKTRDFISKILWREMCINIMLCVSIYSWGIKTFCVSIAYIDYMYLLAVSDTCFRLEGLLPFQVYLSTLFAVFNGVIWLFILLDILIFNEKMVGNFAIIHFKVIGTSIWIFKVVAAGINDLSKKGWYCSKWCEEMYFFDWK